MHMDNQNTLRKIGSQLDSNIFPFVKNGGFVMPSEIVVTSKIVGEEKEHERSRRSKTRTRKGTSRRKGTPSQTSPLISSDFKKQYESEINEVLEAYPKTRVWHQPEGILLLTESKLLVGHKQPATLVVMIPFNVKLAAKGWGFWVGSINIDWIGPRHTNFPDGSICAFEPSDGTWVKGDPIVQLLDLYSLWACRHLYMKTFGRWPGRQIVHFPYERILELKPDEYCGCEHSDRLYGDCCMDKDLKRNIIADAIHFSMKCYGGYRKPPEAIVNFLREQDNPPLIYNL